MYDHIQADMFLLGTYLDGDIMLSDMTEDQVDTLKIMERMVGDDNTYQKMVRQYVGHETRGTIH